MTSTFFYSNKQLHIKTADGSQALRQIVDQTEHSAYVYSLESIRQRISAMKTSLEGLPFTLHYAMKANANSTILQLMRENGCGIDAVSQGELECAADQGFEFSKMILSGVGKSKAELQFSVQNQVRQINVESLSELKRLGEIAKSLQQTCQFGIRLNPDIRVETHPYISTGFRENKFGLPERQLREAVEITNMYSPWLQWKGLSVHIGSQIRDLTPLVDAGKALLRVQSQLKLCGINITSIDLGGGIGIDYKSHDESVELAMLAEYGQRIKALFKDFRGELLFEPGRILVGRCGALLTRVEYIKNNGFKNFIIVNSGMNHLLRPCLYQAHHRILAVDQRQTSEDIFDVVGPICESSDVLGYDRRLPTPDEGDWLAVMDAGAYGFTMSSLYNKHAVPTEICI